MMELMINGVTYIFKAGIGFMYAADKTYVTKDDNGREVKQGLSYMIAEIMDGNIETLVKALYMMNEGQSPRLKKSDIEDYIEDESTDIDELFKEVLDFFEKSNCTKKTVQKLNKIIQEQQTKK